MGLLQLDAKTNLEAMGKDMIVQPWVQGGEPFLPEPNGSDLFSIIREAILIVDEASRNLTHQVLKSGKMFTFKMFIQHLEHLIHIFMRVPNQVKVQFDFDENLQLD